MLSFFCKIVMHMYMCKGGPKKCLESPPLSDTNNNAETYILQCRTALDDRQGSLDEL